MLNKDIYDEIIAVSDEDSFTTGKLIGQSEGVLVGISSGAAAWAAIQLAKRPENEGKTIVVLLPDTGAAICLLRFLLTRQNVSYYSNRTN